MGGEYRGFSVKTSVLFLLPRKKIILAKNYLTGAKDYLDGALSESELKNASELDIIYEHLPGYNTDPSYKRLYQQLSVPHKMFR